MRSETVGKDNLDSVAWDENYFKFCDFENFSVEGESVCSDFVQCSFTNVDWYWGFFSDANFVNCRFKACVFRGSSFRGTKFVECTLTDCRFVKDNLDGDCDFSEAIAYGCTIDAGEGFNAEMR